MPRVKDLSGVKFGKLTVLYQDGINNQNRAMWMCLCECGNRKRISSHDLKHNTVSCGCHAKEVRNKNMEKGRGWNRGKGKKIKNSINNVKMRNCWHESKTRLYRILDGMKRRCYSEKHIHYKNYGGRGIKICDEWLNNFQSFKKWALENGYNENLCIDRINNNGNYEPLNCRWVTVKSNCNNTRANKNITINGITKTLQQWADEYRIHNTTISERLKRGWTGEKVLRQPRKNAM